MVTWRHQSRDD